ncbi:MAG: hypothetical protein AAFU73_18075 [Planctomycetota bacterium]
MEPVELALIVAGAEGEFSVGTGCFVAFDLVLTALHVVEGNVDPVRIRVRGENDASNAWVELAADAVIWKDEKLDAVLLRADRGHSNEPIVFLSTVDAPARSTWTARGYARVNARDDGEWPLLHLQGETFAPGDTNQDLAPVGEPNEAEDWGGCSGAPVVAGGRVIGMLLESPTWSGNRRLRSLRMAALLGRADFKDAIGWGDGEQERELEKLARRVVRLLQRSKAARAELSKKMGELGIECDGTETREDAEFLAKALLHRLSLTDAVHALYCAQHDVDDTTSASVLLEVLELVTPALFDYGIARGVRRSIGAHELLMQIPVSTETTAEILLAARTWRPATFELRESMQPPTGRALLTSPTEIETGFKGNRVVELLVDDLCNWMAIDRDAPDREQKIRAQLAFYARKRRVQMPLYVLIKSETLERRIDSDLRAIRERFPDLLLIELAGDDVESEELHVNLPLREMYERHSGNSSDFDA